MATYNLNAADLATLIANTHLSGGLVSAIDTALITSHMYPIGGHKLGVEVNKGSGAATLSVADTIGLFIETGSNVQDTIKFSSGSGGGHGHHHHHREHGRGDDDDRRWSPERGHVITAGDGDSVSIYDKSSGHDTLIAGYQDTLSIHQTLSVQGGSNLLLGGLYSNVHDTLNGGSGYDTLQVYSGENVLNAGTGRNTLYGGSGSDTLNLGGKGSHDSVVAGSGQETINVASGGRDTIAGYSESQTQVYINSGGQTVHQSTHNGYEVYSYGSGATKTVVNVEEGTATVHFT